MNKKELVAAVAEKSEMTQKVTEKILNGMVEVISEELGKGEDVVLYGLGRFAVKERAARSGRNPRTGESLQIPASKAPSFKASKLLKDAVKNS